jgi:hypothetical protein
MKLLITIICLAVCFAVLLDWHEMSKLNTLVKSKECQIDSLCRVINERDIKLLECGLVSSMQQDELEKLKNK